MLNSDDAIDTLNKAEKSAKDSAKEMEKLGKKAGEMGKAVAVGVVAGVTALGAMVAKSVEATDRIDKMSQKMGMTSKGFQEWDYILGQNGISIDAMSAGMKTLTNMTDGLMNGNKKAAETFGRLGLSMEDLKGKSQEELFDITVKALQGVTDETERAAIANDILGRSGQELAPLLNAGAGAVDELRQKAHDLGIVLDEDAIQAGVKLGDTMDDVKKSFGTVVTKIGVEVMPIFQKLLDWIIRHMPEIQEIMDTVFTTIGDAIEWVTNNSKWLIPVLAGVLGGFVALKVIGTISALISALSIIITGASGVMGIFNAVLLANPIGLMVLAIGALIAAGVALWMNWDVIGAWLNKTFDGIKAGFDSFVNGIIGGMNWIIEKANAVLGTNIKLVDKIQDNNNTTLTKKTQATYQNSNKSQKFSNVGAFADGALVYGNTIANVGEYPGASTNPEVIAPLSDLKGMLGGLIDYDILAKAVAREMKQITVVLDDEKVGKFVDKQILKGAV